VLVHSVRLEQLGEGLAACSGEIVAACLSEVLATVKASASGSSDVAPRNSVTAFGMEDADPTSVGEPCSGF
jgi:hypothetical protein